MTSFARRAASSLVVAAALVVAAPGLQPAPAGAAPATVITKVRLADATRSSLTVTVASLGKGWRYRVYASTRKSDIYYDNLGHAPHRSAAARRPRMTVASLPWTTAPYWYRVQATKGASHRTGPMLQAGLRPTTPTGVVVRGASGGGLSVSWSGSSNGYRVQQATDARFTRGVRTYGTRGTGRQLTPYGVARGGTYWFRVQASNTGTPSGWSGAVRATARAALQPVRVMTFNVLEKDSDGRAAPGGRVAPWSQRRAGVVRYINAATPDLIAVQEAAAWMAAKRGPRQIDDLMKALGGRYKLARTETPPNRPRYLRTGSYVLYRASTYAAVGPGWHFTLGTTPGGGKRFAAYQVVRNRTSGARLLFLSTHLYVGAGVSGDRVRQQQAASLFRQAGAYAARHGGIPVVYGGDFNSHQGHVVDGPQLAAEAAHVADAKLVAQSLANSQFNSGNLYYRLPPAQGLALDHVYASPGVGVVSWRQVLQLRDGLFDGVIPSDHNPVVADLVVAH